MSGVRAHLIDGTYELFRQHFGRPRSGDSSRSEVGAARGVVASVITMLAAGETNIGVASDHVVESFRNDLWPGYKTGAGVPPELFVQFELLERALEALGVKVWAMVELEADDALASAAAVLRAEEGVDQVVIYSPDKDLAQCVVAQRVVQLDRRSGAITDEAGVWARYGVAPASIPDWLALCGDSADGFPGLAGWGRQSASVVLAHYGHLEAVPDALEDWDPAVRTKLRSAARLAERLATERAQAELFRTLATLRVEPQLLAGGSAELRWQGPTEGFAAICEELRDPGLSARVARLAPGAAAER